MKVTARYFISKQNLIMRFFSKLVFICNLCFLGVVIFRWIEITNEQHKYLGEALTFQPLVSTLAILGYGGVILNFIFNIICLLLLVFKKPQPVAKWLIWINLLFLILQVIYFKLY